MKGISTKGVKPEKTARKVHGEMSWWQSEPR
jgi:hypothetical protein